MKLQEFFKEAKITRREFAELTGIAESALHYYITGERQPPLDVAVKINEITLGIVKIEDLIRKEK